MNAFLEGAKDWAQAASVVVSGFAAWAAWSLRQIAKNEMAKMVRATEEKLEAQIQVRDAKIAALELEMARLETRFEEIPSKADHARLEGAIGEVRSAAKRTEEGISRLESYFLNKGIAGA